MLNFWWRSLLNVGWCKSRIFSCSRQHLNKGVLVNVLGLNSQKKIVIWGGMVFQDLHISIIRVSKQHQIVWLSNNKYLLDKAETNIQNYHACEIDSGRLSHYRSSKHDNFDIGRDRVQISVLVSPILQTVTRNY